MHLNFDFSDLNSFYSLGLIGTQQGVPVVPHRYGCLFTRMGGRLLQRNGRFGPRKSIEALLFTAHIRSCDLQRGLIFTLVLQWYAPTVVLLRFGPQRHCTHDPLYRRVPGFATNFVVASDNAFRRYQWHECRDLVLQRSKRGYVVHVAALYLGSRNPDRICRIWDRQAFPNYSTQEDGKLAQLPFYIKVKTSQRRSQ